MPVVFSHEIDPTTLDVSDFQIVTKKGDLISVPLQPSVPHWKNSNSERFF
ncbi:DUF4505 family protein [Leptospira ainazelensis]|nr:DUF4505 family protein [Leptospira ainazelensis]